MTRAPAALLALAAAAAPGLVAAQQWIVAPPPRPAPPEGFDPGAPAAEPVTTSTAQPGDALSAPGGVVRILDKINGTVTDLELATGETGTAGMVTVTLGDCRVPADNPSGDAWELLSIRTARDETALFEGWMIASAPALNAMDNPRYDVWALRCTGV